MDQHNCEDQEPTDTPSTIPSAFQAPMDDTYNPECTHNPMAIQCNQYPNPSHNLTLPQFLAQHNCEDLDPTDTPSAIPTTITELRPRLNLTASHLCDVIKFREFIY